MSTTFYSTMYEYPGKTGCYVRSQCVFDMTLTNDTATISGTVYLQHNGSAASGVSVGATVVSGQWIPSGVSTDSVTSFSAHTAWTNVKSKCQ